MITVENFIADVLYLIKTKLNEITDPLSGSRTNSSFIMTSYPERKVEYPIITLKITNKNATKAGMQTTAMDVTINIEARVWARNQKEKDGLYTNVYNKLKNIQFVDEGTINNGLHDFEERSANEVDEAGKGRPKSRIGSFIYNFYNIT